MSFVLYQWTGNVLREDRKTCSSKPKLNDMKTLFTHFIESKSQQLRLFLHIKKMNHHTLMTNLYYTNSILKKNANVTGLVLCC